MPFTCRPIGAPLEYSDPKLTARSHLDHALDDCAQAGMTGVMYELALLSEYAADVFAGLFAVADATNSRISAVAAQVTTTTKSIAAMEARLQAPLASAAVDMADRARVEHRDNAEYQLFTPASRPAQVSQLVERLCDEPPRLGIMDKYAPGCMAKFSNPDLFLQQFREEEERKEAERRAARDERRRQQAARREKHRARKNKRPREPKRPVAELDWRRNQGQQPSMRGPGRARPSAASNVVLAAEATQLGGARMMGASSRFDTDDMDDDADVDYAAQARASATASAQQRQTQAPRQPQPRSRPAPAAAPAPPVPAPREQRAAPAPPSRGSAAPAPAPPSRRAQFASGGMGMSLRRVASGRSMEAPADLRDGASGGAAAAGGGGGGGRGAGAASGGAGNDRLALLAAIRKGKALKKATPAEAAPRKPAKPANARSSLLEAIRNRQNVKLKKVTDDDRKKEAQAKQEAAAKATPKNTMVAALLARRKAFAADDSDDSSDDSDSDFSD